MTALSFENNNTGITKLQYDDTSTNDYVVTLPHKSCTIAGTDEVDLKAPLASPTFTGTVVLPSTTSIGNVSNVEIGYLDGVTSSIQGQINTAQNTANSKILSTNYASQTTGGTVKMLVSGSTLYIRNDGVSI